MIGSVRNIDLTSAPAAALNRAALRLRRTTRRLWAGAQVRLNLAAAAPRGSLIGASVIPTVRYRDVPKAVDWLCRAFGMRVHRTVTDADGAPRYAELTVGAGMLMVAPIEDTPFGRMMVQPDEIGGVETQVCYLCVGDARAHAARAKAAGAVVIIEPDDEANKGRGYSCRDPEGHVWNFGVYDPWGKLPAPPAPVPGLGLGRVQQGLIALVLLAVAGTLISELLPRPNASASTAVTAATALTPPAEVAPPPKAAKTAAATVATASVQADAPAPEEKASPADDDKTPADRAELEAAEKAAAEARSQLASTRGALAKAEREATAVRAQLEDLQHARLAAERAATEARAKLSALQKTAERARADAALERTRRLATVRATFKARRSAHTRRVRLGTWCYSPTGPVMPTRGSGRLSGFCKG
jgi:uncharacterized glyoxalase superfamily protein PhnB